MKNEKKGFRRIIRLIKIGLAVLSAVFILLCCKMVLNILVVQSYHIPTQSMSPTIMPDDRVLVNKILFGPRINIQGRLHRLPGLRKIRVGDILIFNFPFDKKNIKIVYNQDYFYCKRCIGTPGDTVSIINGYFQNNTVKGSIGYRRNQRLLSGFVEVNQQDSIMNAFPYAKNDWTIKEMGPLYVPKAGGSWIPDSSSFQIYRLVIEYETGCKSQFKNGKLMIGPDTIGVYKFTQNYYFCCGDNLLHSYDGRYWGFVPEEFIVGITKQIFYSRHSTQWKDNWGRFLKKID